MGTHCSKSLQGYTVKLFCLKTTISANLANPLYHRVSRIGKYRNELIRKIYQILINNFGSTLIGLSILKARLSLILGTSYRQF